MPAKYVKLQPLRCSIFTPCLGASHTTAARIEAWKKLLKERHFFRFGRPSFIHNRRDVRAIHEESFNWKRRKKNLMIMFDDDDDAFVAYVWCAPFRSQRSATQITVKKWRVDTKWMTKNHRRYFFSPPPHSAPLSHLEKLWKLIFSFIQLTSAWFVSTRKKNSIIFDVFDEKWASERQPEEARKNKNFCNLVKHFRA